MLHTKSDKSRKLVIVRPFMPECTGCIGQSHSGLCDRCPHKISGVALSKRIEQENTKAPTRENCQTINTENYGNI